MQMLPVEDSFATSSFGRVSPASKFTELAFGRMAHARVDRCVAGPGALRDGHVGDDGRSIGGDAAASGDRAGHASSRAACRAVGRALRRVCNPSRLVLCIIDASPAPVTNRGRRSEIVADRGLRRPNEEVEQCELSYRAEESQA
jgi:hypothetical protein